jgi:hypothetical protein
MLIEEWRDIINDAREAAGRSGSLTKPEVRLSSSWMATAASIRAR